MPSSSLAAVFRGAGLPLELRSYPLPELEPGEVLVRVTCCTLCGSDLHTYEGRRSAPVPTILGHEILGEVAALDPLDPPLDLEGKLLRVGDRVTWSIAVGCGRCFNCEHGIPQKCEDLFKYGHEEIRPKHPLSGGLAEYCHLVEGTAVMRVPDEVPDAVACPANCATATVAAALRVGGRCRDDVVLVQGTGMLGLTACAMARSRGAAEVIACDVDAKRLELAEAFGATRCALIKKGSKDLLRAISDATVGRGVDLAIEVSGAAAAVEDGLMVLRTGGRYVLVGAVFPGRPISVRPESIVRRLLNIHGMHNYTPEDLVEAVMFLKRNHDRFPFAELVAETFPLSQADAAFQRSIKTHALRIAVRP